MSKYIYTFKQINETFERCMNRQMKAFDLTFSQVKVLFVLQKEYAGSCSLKELEAAIGVTQQTMAGLVKRLEAKGLVETFPDPKEHRAKRVCLTDAGRKMDSTVKNNIEYAEEKIMRGISLENEAVIDAAMNQILANLKELEEETSE